MALFITLTLSLVAGICVYVAVINRLMGRMRDGWRKQLGFPLLLIGIVGGFLLVGAWLASKQAGWLMLIPLAGLCLGEAHRLWIRWRYRTAPPVEVQGRPASLLRPVTTTDLQVLRYEVGVQDLPCARLRVAHLSDLHVNDRIPLSYYQSAVARASQAHPDLVLLTGDFVTEGHFTALLPQILGNLEAPLGVYAILGNHDYWECAADVAAALDSVGIRLLGDSLHRIDSETYPGICLLGCERPWGGGICTPRLDPGDFALALSHTADHIYAFAAAGVRAIFSGHFHAGQFQLPVLGPVFVPSAYGRRFAQGHFLVNGAHLFVSAGVGAGEPTLRLYCPPDIFVVDFLKEMD